VSAIARRAEVESQTWFISCFTSTILISIVRVAPDGTDATLNRTLSAGGGPASGRNRHT
jgi:hypothetical protein